MKISNVNKLNVERNSTAVKERQLKGEKEKEGTVAVLFYEAKFPLQKKKRKRIAYAMKYTLQLIKSTKINPQKKKVNYG